jgi:arsenate reductase-like glutaredoxin family protein
MDIGMNTTTLVGIAIIVIAFSFIFLLLWKNDVQEKRLDAKTSHLEGLQIAFERDILDALRRFERNKTLLQELERNSEMVESVLTEIREAQKISERPIIVKQPSIQHSRWAETQW